MKTQVSTTQCAQENMTLYHRGKCREKQDKYTGKCGNAGAKAP